jgi:hypothetical protein
MLPLTLDVTRFELSENIQVLLYFGPEVSSARQPLNVKEHSLL